MRKLELYVDSRLKEFNLYKYMEQILREGTTEVEDDLTIDEIQSISLFSEFVGLATLLDTYTGWSGSQWTNFLTQMMIAFKEKGKPSSINCALAALGIKTSKEAVVQDSDDGFTTNIVLDIIELDTPNVEKFLDRFKQLIPKLLWTHSLNTGDVEVGRVNVIISLNDSYEKTLFDRAVRISVPTSEVTSNNWGV